MNVFSPIPFFEGFLARDETGKEVQGLPRGSLFASESIAEQQFFSVICVMDLISNKEIICPESEEPESPTGPFSSPLHASCCHLCLGVKPCSG